MTLRSLPGQARSMFFLRMSNFCEGWGKDLEGDI